MIRQKETVLLKAEQEASTLSMKVEDALNEVLEAAKKNLPEFWPLFQKLYPDFSKKILSANPDIKTSELILCAYAFLGFTTKDIAVYTFKAIQTVKNNKHNLRKRLYIPPKQDLNIWLRDYNRFFRVKYLDGTWFICQDSCDGLTLQSVKIHYQFLRGELIFFN